MKRPTIREAVSALAKEPIPELFEDGLSADLAEADITSVAEAYKQGYEARDQELKEQLKAILVRRRAVGRKG